MSDEETEALGEKRLAWSHWGLVVETGLRGLEHGREAEGRDTGAS